MNKKDIVIKKLKVHTLSEFEISYEFEGKKVKRNITLKDNELYEIKGLISSKELHYLKQIVEDYSSRSLSKLKKAKWHIY